MKITFYFVRHGETIFNRSGRIQGVCDSPLTERGMEQGKAAGKALRTVWLDKAFTSPSERAMDTADLILEGRDIKPVIVNDLHEYDFGRYEGTRFTSHPDELRHCFDTNDFSSADGETPAKIEVRIRETMKEIIRQCEDGDRVLLAGHGYYAMFILDLLLNVDMNEYNKRCEAEGRRAVPNGGIMVFTYEDGEYSLQCEPTEPEHFKPEEEKKHVTFYYVRHGETRFNMWNRMQGACDSPLTKNGLHQADLAAHALKNIDITAIYSSTSQRARETAEAINRFHNLPVVYTKNLKEVNFGDFEAIVTDSWLEEIRTRHKSETWDDVGGENRADVTARMDAVLNEAVRKAKDGDHVLLVSHGTFYLNMLEHLFDIDRDSYFSERMKAGRQAMPNGGIFVFEYNNGRFSVRELMVSPDEFAR